jgi:uncharacterized protein
MFHESHQLPEEFPEDVEKLQALLTDNESFVRLAEEYGKVNSEIIRIEHEEDHASDQYLEDLKKQRLVLKDQVAEALGH